MLNGMKVISSLKSFTLKYPVHNGSNRWRRCDPRIIQSYRARIYLLGEFVLFCFFPLFFFIFLFLFRITQRENRSAFPSKRYELYTPAPTTMPVTTWHVWPYRNDFRACHFGPDGRAGQLYTWIYNNNNNNNMRGTEYARRAFIRHK